MGHVNVKPLDLFHEGQKNSAYGIYLDGRASTSILGDLAVYANTLTKSTPLLGPTSVNAGAMISKVTSAALVAIKSSKITRLCGRLKGSDNKQANQSSKSITH